MSNKKPVEERVASLYWFYKNLSNDMRANGGAVQAVDLILGADASIEQLVAWLAEPEKIQQALKEQEIKLAQNHIRVPGPDQKIQIIRAILHKLSQSHLYPNPHKLAERVIEWQETLTQQDH